MKLSIIVDPQGWDTAEGTVVDDHVRWIKAVLDSCAKTLWRHCPHTELAEILVKRRSEGPMAFFSRNELGRIVVGLNSQGLQWSQFAFQFAHEFCHVLAAHSNDHTKLWHSTKHANHWLEESLCETASLYALLQMGIEWRSTPPYPKWSSYAVHLENYARDRMQAPEHQVPEGMSFKQWFEGNEMAMRKDPVIREKNFVVAMQLLPLMQREPEGWESITFLNRVPKIEDKSLFQHFRDWHVACAERHQSFVASIAKVFGGEI